MFMLLWHFCGIHCTAIGIPILHTSTRQIRHTKTDLSSSSDSVMHILLILVAVGTFVSLYSFVISHFYPVLGKTDKS
jgi:hypothetical protein